MMGNLDLGEVARRTLRYLIIGVVVAFTLFLMAQRSGKTMNYENIVLVSLTAAATMALLDNYLPESSGALRSGIGLGTGFNLVGFPGAGDL